MPEKKEHASFDGTSWHKDKESGCIYKHPIAKGLEHCDYAKNGYDNLSSRLSLYNKAYQARANKLGYIESGATNTTKVDQEHLAPKDKPKSWQDKWRARQKSPIDLLAKDANAWNVGYIYPNLVRAWWPKGGHKSPPPINYLPKSHGGWDYRYPMKHNWHHVIPAGEFSNLVIYGKAPEGKEFVCTPTVRAQAIIQKNLIGWNINNKDNVVLLPCEEPHALIMQLPSHCPYGLPNHANYINTIKKDLDKVRETLDNAIVKANPGKGHLKEIELTSEFIKKAERDVLEKLLKLTDVNQ